MHHFFLTPAEPLTVGGLITLPPDISHQVGHVLRLRVGARVAVLDGQGSVAEVELTTVGRNAVVGQVVEVRPAPAPPQPALTLYAAVLKGERFTWTLQKATELGVAAIVPLITERTIVPWAEASSPAKHERWARIIREAAEQSGRGLLPHLHAPLRWPVACQRLADEGGPVLLFWEEATAPCHPALTAARAASHVAAVIGPEGGLSAGELDIAAVHGLTAPLSLGPLVLRAETAAMAVCALVLLG